MLLAVANCIGELRISCRHSIVLEIAAKLDGSA